MAINDVFSILEGGIFGQTKQIPPINPYDPGMGTVPENGNNNLPVLPLPSGYSTTQNPSGTMTNSATPHPPYLPLGMSGSISPQGSNGNSSGNVPTSPSTSNNIFPDTTHFGFDFTSFGVSIFAGILVLIGTIFLLFPNASKQIIASGVEAGKEFGTTMIAAA